MFLLQLLLMMSMSMSSSKSALRLPSYSLFPIAYPLDRYTCLQCTGQQVQRDPILLSSSALSIFPLAQRPLVRDPVAQVREGANPE